MVGKVLRFDISVNNSNGVYQPGESISGYVSVKLADDIPCKGVYLWMVGQSDVSWPDGRSKTHFEYEIYMKEFATLWGQEPGHRRQTPAPILPGGAHEYSFSFKLPTNIPSTFESQDACKGRVHYVLRARLDSPDESIRQTCDKTFVVLSSLDLNRIAKTADAIQLRKDKRPCCCCCKSGPVTCVLRLDRTGYVPGEDINLDAEIQNLSRKEVTASYVTMQQIIQFHAHGYTKTTTSDIFRISGGKIKSGDNALYHDIIHIPPLPPSRLQGCNLIDIEYIITVGVLPSGMSQSVEVSVIITIGTHPLTHFLPPGTKITPSFSRYSHTSGEIEDYVAEDFHRGKHQHVYHYYKTLYKPQEDTV